jgi:lysozyme
MTAPALAKGIDVSHWQTVSDWGALYDTGVRFVGIKATQGLGTDPKFAGYQQGARTAPFLLRIFYAYLMPGDAVAQARALLDATGSLLDNERLCLDLEHRDSTGRLDVTLAQVDTFMTTLLGGACSDRRPLLYTSRGIWGELGDPAWALASDVDLWLKRYAPAPGQVPPPWAARGWAFWQSSETGSNSAIPGNIDLDVFVGDEPALATYARLTPAAAVA